MVRLWVALLLLVGIGQLRAQAQSSPPPLIGATYQSFERGLMVWNVVDSEIWVYVGGTSGQLFIVPLWMYGEWQVDLTPIPPGGGFLPLNGFGKVWNTFPGLREDLGWATTPEIGYLLQTQHNRRGELVAFTLPDGRLVKAGGNDQWWLPGGIYVPPLSYPEPTLPPDFAYPTPTPIGMFLPMPTPPATPSVVTVDLAFQCFQNGYMIRREDTGSVYAVFDLPMQYSTYWIEVLPWQYINQPLLTDTPTDPFLYAPAGVFGQVWAYSQPAREILGWATQPETTYSSAISLPAFDQSNIRIGIPGGGAVDLMISGWWTYPSLGNTHGCP